MNSVNTELARFNMIEQQIRTWEVLDEDITDLLSVIPRETFVPQHLQNLAYADTTLPIGEGQIMLSPKTQARIVQNLRIQKHERILEIGCGTGYSTALLAHRGRTVDAIDIFPSLVRTTQRNLEKTATHNVNTFVANGAQFRQFNKYDVIVLSGGVTAIPEGLKNHLHTGGRLFAIVGEDPIMRATIITKQDAHTFTQSQPWDTLSPQLLHFDKEKAFVL